ncbi:LacI family DNA-binding transcriptional regulator [Herbaspirillum huttiense F1]|jgi:Transcriptional regulators|uniref:LacI family DNA-binding transcriptional regulator n=1 Tax=Herbaspirillum huttiense subsp. lycopersici TaxID=3074428 RepID=A0ABU2EH81_9BURK|nr:MULTISPECIES: LacI family DNA-binding transcriptional regulator [Herbaspirillum]MBP1313761.1 LacI family transcriptional regulator [Herbaspirillum sp. 1130]MDR6738950.1 LacI family transcriptional regulator [Herbaspirillum sp. 1173]MDR9847494.1 LacI family DNA-binding transcriptional regulator [Herbaspirillum huttiense SE1]MDT0354967.1 LacI family DNA-binding transcriptional regulator [Herbaspirillum huttiense F1]
MSRLTIKDVAKAAGVSFQTVSLVLNHPEKVAPRTRELVQAAIDSLNFIPNVAARSLRNISTRTLACVMFNGSSYDERSERTQDTHYHNVVQTLTRAADRAGYTLLQRNLMREDEASLVYVRDLFLAGRIDGMIAMVNRAGNPVVNELHRLGYPCVVYGMADPACHHVVQSDRQAGLAVVEHLYRTGCRRIALVTGPHKDHEQGKSREDGVPTSSEARYFGYLDGLEKCGLTPRPEWIVTGDWSLESGYRAAAQLCHQSERPDAIFLGNDRMALGALKALYDLGVKVPQEISVVGFDNMRYADFSIPSLTSVDAPMLEMCEFAVKLLLERIELRQEQRNQSGDAAAAQAALVQKMFSTHLVIRDSTRPVM